MGGSVLMLNYNKRIILVCLDLPTGQLNTTATIITETGSVEVDSLDVCPINDPNTQLHELTS